MPRILHTEDTKFMDAWRRSSPNGELTFLKIIDGKGVVDLLKKHHTLQGKVCEIGPGYGRVIKSLDTPIGDYTGIDISPNNISYLTRELSALRTYKFICSDFLATPLTDTYDLIYAFLCFKHQYPNFKAMLNHAFQKLNPGGKVIFDIPWGEYFQDFDTQIGGWFISVYSKKRIELIIRECGISKFSYDEVLHCEDQKRLAVIIEK